MFGGWFKGKTKEKIQLEVAYNMTKLEFF